METEEISMVKKLVPDHKSFDMLKITAQMDRGA